MRLFVKGEGRGRPEVTRGVGCWGKGYAFPAGRICLINRTRLLNISWSLCWTAVYSARSLFYVAIAWDVLRIRDLGYGGGVGRGIRPSLYMSF